MVLPTVSSPPFHFSSPACRRRHGHLPGLRGRTLAFIRTAYAGSTRCDVRGPIRAPSERPAGGSPRRAFGACRRGMPRRRWMSCRCCPRGRGEQAGMERWRRGRCVLRPTSPDDVHRWRARVDLEGPFRTGVESRGQSTTVLAGWWLLAGAAIQQSCSRRRSVGSWWPKRGVPARLVWLRCHVFRCATCRSFRGCVTGWDACSAEKTRVERAQTLPDAAGGRCRSRRALARGPLGSDSVRRGRRERCRSRRARAGLAAQCSVGRVRDRTERITHFNCAPGTRHCLSRSVREITTASTH